MTPMKELDDLCQRLNAAFDAAGVSVTDNYDDAIRVLVAERDAARQEVERFDYMAKEWMAQADARREEANALRTEVALARQEAAAAQAAWASDVAEWKEWLLGAEQARDGWQQLAEQAEAALAEARRVLREVEWDRSGECPLCGGLRDGDTHVYHASHVEVVRGHFPACALAAVLAQEEK